jgi:hypothetical protein
MLQRLQTVVAVTVHDTLKIKFKFKIFSGLIQIHAQNYLSGGRWLTLKLYIIHV